jgi:hypothetical protein
MRTLIPHCTSRHSCLFVGRKLCPVRPTRAALTVCAAATAAQATGRTRTACLTQRAHPTDTRCGNRFTHFLQNGQR